MRTADTPRHRCRIPAGEYDGGGAEAKGAADGNVWDAAGP
jgi:hypothetical protein